MSFLPPGFSMSAEYARMYSSHLDIRGMDCSWTPAGGSPVSVRVIREDPNALAAAAVMMTLWGAIVPSGFTQTPVKNDTVVVNTVTYRVFDVQGPDESGGIYLHLTK